MSNSNPLQGNPEGPELRKAAGAFLKKARVEAGLTQVEVATAMGAPYYTIVSQIESGKTRLPPKDMMAVARVLKLQPRKFYTRLMQYYDPYGWEMLFGPNAEKE